MGWGSAGLRRPSSAASFLLVLPVPYSALGWDREVLGQPHCGQHQAKTMHLGTTEAARMRSTGTSLMQPTAHLSSHAGDEAGLNGPTQHIPPQTGVLGVLQVADPAPHPVAILHVCALQLLEDMWGPSRNQVGDASLGAAVTRASGHMQVADLSGAFLRVGSVPILGFKRMKHSLRCGEENDFAWPWNV